MTAGTGGDDPRRRSLTAELALHHLEHDGGADPRWLSCNHGATEPPATTAQRRGSDPAAPGSRRGPGSVAAVEGDATGRPCTSRWTSARGARRQPRALIVCQVSLPARASPAQNSTSATTSAPATRPPVALSERPSNGAPAIASHGTTDTTMAIRPRRNSIDAPPDRLQRLLYNERCTNVARVPRTVDPVERRARVATAARAVIARDGLDAATVRQVAAEAGSSTTGVTHYFADKQALLLAAVEDAYAAVATRMVAHVEAGPGGLPTLRAVLREALPL